MSKLGYRVKVFNDCPNKSYWFGDIEYIHWKYFGEWNDMNYADYFISSRSLEPFKLPFLRAGKKFVMIHDIWIMLNNPEDIRFHEKVDKFFCLSTEHKKFVSEHHKIDLERILITSNGIDLNRFIKRDERRRKPFKAIYASSPDRGLENLLDMLPSLREKIPKLELHVYYGFDFVKGHDEWVQSMLQRMTDLGVVYHGKVNQEELAKAYMTSRVVLAPNWFEETFKISAIEAMASGCVYLGSEWWGIKDTVGGANPLIPMADRFDCTREPYQQQFIDEAEKLFNDRAYFKKWQKSGFERVKRFSWSTVANQFDEYFKNTKWTEIQF